MDNYATLRGRTVKAAIFDQGAVYAEHQEFVNGVRKRVAVRTQPTDPYDNHPTQVASVMAARGADKRAIGVAQELNLLSFQFQRWPFGKELDDLTKVAGDVHVSNHSYVPLSGWKYINGDGWYWYGDPKVSPRVDAKYGKYTEPCSRLDAILAGNPYLLTFVAAGNERSDESGLPFPAGAIPHKYLKSVSKLADGSYVGNFEPSMEPREPNDYKGEGLDTIPGLGLAKNAICIGATENVVKPNDFPEIAAFSSWGPADDGRIKPDLIAMGQDVYAAEPFIEGDPLKIQRPAGYNSVDGTSFATPTAAGIGALLVEVFHTKRGRWPTSAEIKAVLIHTAIDGGKQAGPDPEFGWGVINALEAGRIVATEDRRIGENRLMQTGELGGGESRDHAFPSTWATGNTLRATLVWTDPPAKPNAGGLDDDTRTLVNDLDLELVAPNGRVFHPYRLDPADPRREASTDAANHVDNVEVIDVAPDEALRTDPGQGTWTVRVKAPPRLEAVGRQAYALIVSGVAGRPRTSSSRTLAAGQITPARGRWTSLGPHGLGGPTRDLAIHPDRPQTLWAACSAGGVWKTEDGGEHWSLTTGRYSSFPNCTLALDPNDPDTIYAGTGDGSWAGYPDGRAGVGILKSRDGGRSWAVLPATAGYDFRYVNRLAISPDGGSLLAATRRGLFRSSDGGGSFLGVSPPLNDIEIVDVEYHPSDASRCVASGRPSQAFVSADGGLHWTQATGIPSFSRSAGSPSGRIEMEYAKAAPSIVYALVDRSFEIADGGAELFRSSDGGSRFIRVNTLKEITSEFWFCSLLWAGDPSDASIVVAGNYTLHRSKDGGRTIEEVGYSNNIVDRHHLRWWPLNSHFILADPRFGSRRPDGTTNRVVYVASEAGVHRFDDIIRAEPVIESRNGGYDATPFIGAAGHAATGRIVGGTPLFGTLGYSPAPQPGDGTQPWEILNRGYAGHCAIDPTDPSNAYGQNNYLAIYKVGKNINAFNWIAPIDDQESRGANFKAPFLLDPNAPDTMLAGSARLLRKRGLKQKTPAELATMEWEPLKAASATGISAIAVPRGGRGSQVIWVGHNDGEIWRTLDGAKTWQRMSDKPTTLPKRQCTWIAIDPRDDRTVYAAFDGDNAGNVWMTPDDGVNWIDISGSLPEVPVRTLAIHPDNSLRLYLGNDLGVYISNDGGSNWSPVNEGPANVAVSELFWMDRKLVAATLRGLYQIDASEIGK